MARKEGVASVLRNPSDHKLVAESEHLKKIDESKSKAKSEGVESVVKDPSLFGLIGEKEHNDLINTNVDLNEPSVTPYTTDWFYLPSRGWLWTNNSSYPFFFDGKTMDWLYFSTGREKPRFYDYGKKEWIVIE